MSARGTMRKDVAAALDVHPETISVWIARFEARGVEGLKPDYCGGQQPLIPEALAAEIVEWVKQGPQACGIDRANWTFAELADHLFAMRGIRVSETTMRDFCHRHEIRPYRPTYRFLRSDEEKKAVAREELSALKRCS